MMYELKALPLSPANDPWESIDRRIQFGKNMLTSVEFTVTNLCNLRCEHCAVGDVLTHKESDERVPIEILIQRLEEYVVPLQYAHRRGARTQINSNLTLDLERYEAILPYLDL